MSHTMFYISVDPAFQDDYTAIVLVQRVPKSKQPLHNHAGIPRQGNELDVIHMYHVVGLERVRGLPYPELVEKVSRIWENPRFGRNHEKELILDTTGVGLPIAQEFEQKRLHPIKIVITGGHQINQKSYTEISVPKRNLVSALGVMFHSGRIKFASMPLVEELVKELESFSYKVNPETGHDSYEASTGAHDDLVMALSMAVWRAHGDERYFPNPYRFSARRNSPDRRSQWKWQPVFYCPAPSKECRLRQGPGQRDCDNNTSIWVCRPD